MNEGLLNHGKVHVKVTNERENGCIGIRDRGIPAYFDNVPLYDYVVLSGDPFLDNPLRRFTFLQGNLITLSHLECKWLQEQGVEVKGMLDLDKEGVKITLSPSEPQV